MSSEEKYFTLKEIIKILKHTIKDHDILEDVVEEFKHEEKLKTKHTCR